MVDDNRITFPLLRQVETSKETMVLLLHVFLIYLCLITASAQYVLDMPKHSMDYQIDFPWQKEAKVDKSVSLEIKSPSDTKFTFKCTSYVEEDTKVDVYDKNGIFLDTLAFSPNDNPCDQSFINNVVYVQDPLGGTVKIIYLWASKKASCVERTYLVTESALMALVEKLDYPRVECPQRIKDYIGQVPAGKAAGGIVSLGPVEAHHDFDFNQNVFSRGEPKALEFPTKDPKGQTFKLICREDTFTADVFDPVTKKSSITTGSIVHQENEAMVIDKFKMTSCSTEYINVNRQIFNNHNHYKVVYKHANGNCYERFYENFGNKDMFYYRILSVLHFYPRKVKCPTTFVGDININAYHPWYRRFLQKIFPKSRATPFAIETGSPKSKGVEEQKE